jgi:hypothetical protein
VPDGSDDHRAGVTAFQTADKVGEIRERILSRQRAFWTLEGDGQVVRSVADARGQGADTMLF